MTPTHNHRTAPECTGRVYGCPKCGGREMTIDELHDHTCGGDVDALRLIHLGTAFTAEVENDLEDRGLIVQTDQPYATVTDAGKRVLVADAVARAKREIVEDITSGAVPATVSSFSELHDHVDANEYGGLCDETYGDFDIDFANAVQTAVDEWIAAGRPS